MAYDDGNAATGAGSPPPTVRCPCSCRRAVPPEHLPAFVDYRRLEWTLAASASARRWLADGAPAPVRRSLARGVARTGDHCRLVLSLVVEELHGEPSPQRRHGHAYEALVADVIAALVSVSELAARLGGPGLEPLEPATV